MNEKKIRVGILGWGNLGRGAALALRQNPDMELAAVFTRRDPARGKSTARCADVSGFPDPGIPGCH